MKGIVLAAYPIIPALLVEKSRNHESQADPPPAYGVKMRSAKSGAITWKCLTFQV
jgi:hypothetical protein